MVDWDCVNGMASDDAASYPCDHPDRSAMPQTTTKGESKMPIPASTPVKTSPSLDINVELDKLRQMYKEDKKQESFNLLLLGESGTGKTFITRTCRTPVLIDSFDPGGTKGLRKEIEAGDIIVDTRWEDEDPMNPKAFKLWEAEFERRLKLGFFNQIGTYVLDSATTWSDAIMNHILKRAGIPGQAPRFTHDYTPQKIIIRNKLQKMLSLPCDFILTGHLEAQKDDVTGKVKWRFLTTGKGTVTIPLLFDEIYVTTTKETSKGVTYQLLTARTSTYMAATRIGRDKFETYEKPDIKYLLKKAGL